MKVVILIVGILLFLIGLAGVIQYYSDYEILSQYGKGYFWGKVTYMILGGAGIFLYFWMKRKQSSK